MDLLLVLIIVFGFSQTLELNIDNVLDKLEEHGFSDVKWPVLAASLKQGGAVQGIQTNVSGRSSVKLNALI